MNNKIIFSSLFLGIKARQSPILMTDGRIESFADDDDDDDNNNKITKNNKNTQKDSYYMPG